jgi:hypothetical protein
MIRTISFITGLTSGDQDLEGWERLLTLLTLLLLPVRDMPFQLGSIDFMQPRSCMPGPSALTRAMLKTGMASVSGTDSAL